MDKRKTLETSLVLTTAFLVIFVISGNRIFLYVASGFGFTGIFIQPLANLIAKGWFALAESLNFVMSKLILGTLFYLILTPVALIYRLLHPDKLQLASKNKSTWRIRGKTYSESDLKNIW